MHIVTRFKWRIIEAKQKKNKKKKEDRCWHLQEPKRRQDWEYVEARVDSNNALCPNEVRTPNAMSWHLPGSGTMTPPAILPISYKNDFHKWKLVKWSWSSTYSKVNGTKLEEKNLPFWLFVKLTVIHKILTERQLRHSDGDWTPWNDQMTNFFLTLLSFRSHRFKSISLDKHQKREYTVHCTKHPIGICNAFPRLVVPQWSDWDSDRKFENLALGQSQTGHSEFGPWMSGPGSGQDKKAAIVVFKSIQLPS